MFVLKSRGDTAALAWQRVTIAVPDGDAVRETAVNVQYRILRQSEIDDTLNDVLEDSDIEGTIRFLGEVAVDWRGMHREGPSGDPEPLECTPETIAEVCDLVYVRRALLDGFFRAVSGNS